MREQNRFWIQLLKIVGKGNVVPIIGEELLLIPNSRRRKLYQVLARRYAEFHNLEMEEKFLGDLSTTIRNHPEFRSNPYDVYQGLAEEYDALHPDIPEPLRALARIKDFNLFITTTFDNLLERAINDERFQGRRVTQVIAYSPKKIPSDQEIEKKLSSGKPVIFQIFGNYNTPLKFALTEGDIVEYMHALQSIEYRPKRIFSELYERPILMIGNNFPDWLARFFIRLTRKSSLDQREAPKQYFADERVKSDPILKLFLRKFATNTELIDSMNTVQFTMELSRRWVERFSTHIYREPRTAIIGKPIKSMPKNAVFISYCSSNPLGDVSNDALVAVDLKKALKEAGIDVWLDQDRLQAGDDYEIKIQRYVKTCSIFIPIISKTTQSRDSGFFRREWAWALNRLPEFTGSDRQFVVPVVIDNLDPYEAKVPEDFKRIQFLALEHGRPSAKLIDRIKELYEMARAETVSGVA